MALTDYTSYAEIRAVLGVSDTDIDDATLALPIYEQQLLMALYKVHPNLATLFASIHQIPVDQRTALQQRLYNVTQVYAAYAVARYLLASAPLFAFQKLKDGRAEGDRFANAFDMLRDDLDNMLADLVDSLEDLLTDLGEEFPAKVGMTYFAASEPNFNPITGI